MRDRTASGQLDELGGRKRAGSEKILRSHNDVDDETRPAPGTGLQAARPEPCPRSLIRTTAWPNLEADRLATGPFQAQLRLRSRFQKEIPAHAGPRRRICNRRSALHFRQSRRDSKPGRHRAIVLRDCNLARVDAPKSGPCAKIGYHIPRDILYRRQT
jgi:hypothetical protein